MSPEPSLSAKVGCRSRNSALQRGCRTSVYHRFGDRPALTRQDINLPQIGDDLFGFMVLPCHRSIHPNGPLTNIRDGSLQEGQAIAALLHEAVEDQGGLPTARQTAKRFGERVAGIVLTCTDATPEPGETKAPWRERKTASVRRLKVSGKIRRFPTLMTCASTETREDQGRLNGSNSTVRVFNFSGGSNRVSATALRPAWTLRDRSTLPGA